MTCQRFHTVSRMRENCTYGSMRGRAYPAGASRPTLHPIVFWLHNVISNEHCGSCKQLGTRLCYLKAGRDIG